jgi:mono/diheme cytochrome c family protein
MGKFLLGVIVGLVVLAGGAYLYLRLGYLDFRADVHPSGLESHQAMAFLDASADRRAAEEKNPVEPTEANLMQGMELYKTHCAECHGAPDHPEKKFGHPFYPPAPQFMTQPADMPESENFYIIQHGIRWTGMPAWENTLSDQQIWTLVTFLSHMQKLPASAQQKWEKASTSGLPQAEEQDGGRHE